MPQKVQNVSVVLVRSVEFPLVFSVKNVATSGIRSEVGLHLLCKISNINEFYENALLEAPNFVKPHIFKNLAIPSEHSTGNHARICDLKLKAAEAKTRFHRLDLYVRYKQGFKNEK